MTDGNEPGAFRAIAAATGEPIGPYFAISTPGEVAAACADAERAFDAYRATDADARARFWTPSARRSPPWATR